MEARYALTLQPQYPSVLRSGGNRHAHGLVIQRRDHDDAPARTCVKEMGTAQYTQSVSLVQIVRLDPQEDVQVAVTRPVGPSVTLPRKAEPLAAAFDPRSDVAASVRLRRTRPVPRQAVQGFSTISPSPLRLGRFEAMEKNPEFLRT